MNLLDCAVKGVLNSITVTERNKNIAELKIRQNIFTQLENLGLSKVPDFFIDLLVLQKMKDIFEEEKDSKLVLQRNLTLKELNFLREKGIKVFFGDYEIFDEEFLLSDFKENLYLVDYDIEKSFIYAHAFKFKVEENFENNYMS